ncbi:unnamed protein product [Candida verbasci]|uniref:Myb-like domain-containing protein n=1 Tax=Candida verbasci TaxID=1227364 RepID=A0A9W4TRF1_9ASCO|nr:unnamed protein product [Candida verbasci]
MSSILKKGSLTFKPKVKPNIQKKSSQSKTLPTPPSTQQSQTQTSNDSSKSFPGLKLNLNLASPESSQKKSKDDDIDPKDTSKNNDHAIESDSGSENDSDDSDLFKLPNKRRTSIVHQRRLSGINTPGYRSRSASVSLNQENQPPAAKISIPVSKQIKRRRSSIQINKAKKIQTNAVPIISTTAPISKIINVKQPTPEKTPEPETIPKKPINYVSDKFVVGLCPITNKLKKYRRKNASKKEEQPDGYAMIADITADDLLPEEPDNLITTITSIHQIPKDIKPDDIELFAEVNYDLEEMTMADLCKPTINLGKVSSNYQLIIEAEQQLKLKKEQRKRDRIYAREKGISLEQATIELENEKRKLNGEEPVENKDEEEKERNTLFDNLDQDEPKYQHSALKLTLQNGKIGYSEESQIITKPRADASSRTYEEENPYANPITSTTYSKRIHSERWQPEELIKFYQALSMFGTDFSLISQLFPYRTRKQVKSKFTLEEKKFPEVVELALKRKLPTDFEKYCKAVKKDLKSLEAFNEELRTVRIQHEKDMEEIAIAKEKAFKEDAEATRQREIEIRTGTKPMTKAERIKELRKNEQVVGSIDDIKRERNASVSINP